VDAQVLNDTVNGQGVVLVAADSIVRVHGYSYREGDISYSAGGQVRAYERGDYRFRPGEYPEQLLDQQDQIWQMSEQELISEEGVSLRRINGHLSFWFGWSAFYTETAVYSPE
ncbi:MAG: hypothetical protein AAF490_17825, partial [Chloroflexota bacterium]